MSSNNTSKQTVFRELRQFGLVFAAGLILVFGILIPWLADRPWPTWPWLVAALFVTLALVFPRALAPINWIWLKIGHVLGWINTRIILGLVFFAIVLPIGLLMRALGKDPMARKFDAASTSYRVPSKPHPKEQMERPF